MKREIFLHRRFIETTDITTDSVREIEESQTIGEVLKLVSEESKRVRFNLFDEQENLRPHVVIFLDSQPHKNLEIPVGNCKTISILPALSGG